MLSASAVSLLQPASARHSHREYVAGSQPDANSRLGNRGAPRIRGTEYSDESLSVAVVTQTTMTAPQWNFGVQKGASNGDIEGNCGDQET